MCVVCIKKKPPHNRVRACPSMTSPSCIPHDVCLRCSNSLFLLWNLAPQRTHVTRVTSVAFNIACFRNNSTLGSLATQAKHRAAAFSFFSRTAFSLFCSSSSSAGPDSVSSDVDAVSIDTMFSSALLLCVSPALFCTPESFDESPWSPRSSQ